MRRDKTTGFLARLQVVVITTYMMGCTTVADTVLKLVHHVMVPLLRWISFGNENDQDIDVRQSVVQRSAITTLLHTSAAGFSGLHGLAVTHVQEEAHATHK